MTSPAIIKAALRRVSAQVFEKHPVLFAYLYGSYAEGAVHPFSDLDIAVYSAEASVSGNLRLELSLALEIDATLGEGIETEVRVINHLPMVVKGRIITEGELIYSRNDELRVDFETSVRKQYFDFLPALAAYQDRYLESHEL